jgi:hypothetical protein
VLGIVSGLLVDGISSLLFSGLTPWIMGALAANPIFLALVFASITFVAGLVRLFQPKLWPLTYRQLPISTQVEAARFRFNLTNPGQRNQQATRIIRAF